MKIYFTEKLADVIALDYQYLIGQVYPSQFGELIIDEIGVVQVFNGEFDIVLRCNLDGVEFRELYEVLNVSQMRLLDYLILKRLEFNPQKYGALLGKFTSEKDEDGIDLYL